MPEYVTGITNHITDMDTASNRLGTRLVTTTTMTISPHHVTVIPVTPSSHSLQSPNIHHRTECSDKKSIIVYQAATLVCYGHFA